MSLRELLAFPSAARDVVQDVVLEFHPELREKDDETG